MEQPATWDIPRMGKQAWEMGFPGARHLASVWQSPALCSYLGKKEGDKQCAPGAVLGIA